MSVIGALNLPVADRGRAWDGSGARRRVFELCTSGENVDAACVARAFLWRDGDPQTMGSYALGFADVIDGRLMIVPRGVAACAGGRGVGAADIPEADKARIRSKICSLYARIQREIEDWPDCPFSPDSSAKAKPARKKVKRKDAITAAATGTAWEGVLAVEGIPTGDGRKIAAGALRWENLPLPLVFDVEEMDHSGMTVGTVDEIRREGASIVGSGHFSESSNADVAAVVERAKELLREEAIGVSVDLDDVVVDEEDQENMTVTSARIRGLAIVDIPAFIQAEVKVLDEETEEEQEAVVAHALGPSVVREWFADPRFGNGEQNPREDGGDERLVWQEPEHPEEEPQYGAPLTITSDGRIYGHAALWYRCHVGYAGSCVRPPKEPRGYRGYLTGERVEGVPTGPLTIGTTHARLAASLQEAERHYADTGRAVADLTVGPDAYGIWVAGALRPGVDRVQVEALRGSALSGDWRNVGGSLRLIAILAVNAPGFRIARAIAASAALITVGPGCETCPEEVSLEERVARLEQSLGA